MIFTFSVRDLTVYSISRTSGILGGTCHPGAPTSLPREEITPLRIAFQAIVENIILQRHVNLVHFISSIICGRLMHVASGDAAGIIDTNTLLRRDEVKVAGAVVDVDALDEFKRDIEIFSCWHRVLR